MRRQCHSDALRNPNAATLRLRSLRMPYRRKVGHGVGLR